MRRWTAFEDAINLTTTSKILLERRWRRIKYYAIQNKRDKRLVSGTDFRHWPRHQIYASEWRPPLLITRDKEIYSVELQRRGINLKRFRLIEIEIDIGEEK